MRSRLLFFEGSPGSGKSSLSQFVAQQLQAANAPVQWIEEHTLNESVFAAFFDALDDAAPKAINVLLTCWDGLLDRLRADSATYCLDGAFFHSTLKLLLAYDYDRPSIERYLQALYVQLSPFQPTLIQLGGDVPAIMQITIAERGPQWAANVAEDVAQYPCQQRQGSSGLEGMVDFFAESQRQMDRIATDYPFAYYRVDSTAREWSQYQHAVCAWLGISLHSEAQGHISDPAHYAGTYQTPSFFPPEFNHQFQVEHTPDGLRLHMVFMRNFRLVNRQGDRFAIVGRPLQLEFVRDAQGALIGAVYPFVPDQQFFCEKIA